MIFLSRGIRVFHTPSPLTASPPPSQTSPGLPHAVLPTARPTGHPITSHIGIPRPRHRYRPAHPLLHRIDAPTSHGRRLDPHPARRAPNRSQRVTRPTQPKPGFQGTHTHCEPRRKGLSGSTPSLVAMMNQRRRDCSVGIGIATPSARLVIHSQASPIKAADHRDEGNRTTCCSYSSYCI